jgi:hypothetical protein
MPWILAMVLCSTAAMAIDDQPPAIQGRVVELTDAQGFDHLTILTPRGEMMRFRLGEAGTSRSLLLDGDQVRICPVDGTPVDGARLARGIKVRRTGAWYSYRNRAGDMNQQWVRTRARDGSCGGTPGAGCPGGGGAAGGSRGGGGHGGGGGGGNQRGGGR